MEKLHDLKYSLCLNSTELWRTLQRLRFSCKSEWEAPPCCCQGHHGGARVPRNVTYAFLCQTDVGFGTGADMNLS